MPWGESVTGTLLEDVRWVNASVIDAVDELGEGAFHARPGRVAPSIAFHLWHVGRWADLFQARLPTFADALARLGPREQVWEHGRLAEEWGLVGSLGRNDTGWGLDDDASAALPLPGRDVVVGYARSSFDVAEEVFSSLRDDELLERTRNFYDDEPWVVLDHITWYTGHTGRHLGMIEALKGVLGLRGTVTS